jgi:hypothetical protein
MRMAQATPPGFDCFFFGRWAGTPLLYARMSQWPESLVSAAVPRYTNSRKRTSRTWFSARCAPSGSHYASCMRSLTRSTLLDLTAGAGVPVALANLV